MTSLFPQKLLNWYDKNARVLPWRGHPDPYAVWVSEIMLQQTRVETVIPFFQRWMRCFPTIFKLAAASQKDVLNIWEGLGYYRRGRNLHRSAKMLVENLNGELPKDFNELQKLPGIGRYTAAAISSIAFGQDQAALDGNIRRVLSRVFNVTELLRSTRGERFLWNLAAEHLPSGRAGDYNQAIMDLGATICIPKNPDCGQCPVKDVCLAKALGIQDDRPVSVPKAKIPHYTVTAAVIQREGMVMIVQRPPNGLLGGMWEFPGGKQEPDEDLTTCIQREVLEELNSKIRVGEPFGVYEHAYTHFRVSLHAFLCSLNGTEPQINEHTDLRWVTPSELGDFPMGKIDRSTAKNIQKRAQRC